ncbi:ribonuclease III [Parasphingopyxis lamellibrachiae]|uniref:Ribonuclease 3 n=1 Tax=Parasphingopyxis lamellibrachiae TaxID=680125 RepID=A0A3D9FIY1_9SPHN|nr:ribonuclease III [Parasphingopyxis lamellibrachiae]RED17740.1 RNAse III [Parasphingopyxis lamellibrachiae]
MNDNPETSTWLADTLGHTPHDTAIFARALTHPSMDEPDYQRLEFLGDRVLGLIVSTWLYERHENDPEGQLNSRLAALVSRSTCAAIGREIGVAAHIRLGKQARDDGSADSDNVLGDVVEALIGALYLDGSFDTARSFVYRRWESRVEEMDRAPQHPKSALQEWAAANRCKPPVYTIADRSGPAHNPHFRMRVEIPNRDHAEAEGSSKQEAEKAAAKALLEKLS